MTEAARILIVDDEPNLRRTLAMILARGGYQSAEADNAAAALARLKTAPFDLLFLDLNMPDRYGADLMADIRQAYPNLPVLILTAHATLDSAMEAVRQGARDYMVKPIEPEYILRRVREILGESQQPLRKREIVSEIQGLLVELQEMEGQGFTPTSLLAAVPPAAPGRVLVKGGFVLDLHARHATLDGRYLTLSGSNFDYLMTLVRHAPTTVGYRALVQESQGYDVIAVEARTLARWRVHELRQVLEAEPRQPARLMTVRGVGYRLVV